MFKVIEGFHDLQDGAREYKPGDEYPRAGYTPAPGRIEELSGVQNARRTPLIEAIEEAPEETEEAPVEAPEAPTEDKKPAAGKGSRRKK